MNRHRFGHGQTPASSTSKRPGFSGYHPNMDVKPDEHAHEWITKRYWLEPYYRYDECTICHLQRAASEAQP